MGKAQNMKQEEMNPTLFEVLKCPVCFDLPKPPIHQCPTGHHFCERCYGQLKSSICPLCKISFTNTRNFLAEDLIQKLPIIFNPDDQTNGNKQPRITFCSGRFPCCIGSCSKICIAGHDDGNLKISVQIVGLEERASTLNYRVKLFNDEKNRKISYSFVNVVLSCYEDPLMNNISCIDVPSKDLVNICGVDGYLHEVLPPSNNHEEVLPPSNTHEEVLPPSNNHEVLPPSNTHEEVLLLSNTHEEVLPPSNNHEEVLPPFNTHEEVLPPSNTHEEVLPPSNTHEEVLPPSNTHEEVLPPSNINEEELSHSSTPEEPLSSSNEPEEILANVFEAGLSLNNEPE
ncbi:hypothetical protein C0J52_18042 [Blattella germanica]|nr:hypothetical protein C0J52_18042 [Blattella germanica]